MIRDTVRSFAMLDIEASALEGGWPIEVGLSWLDEAGAPQGWSSLVRPARSWSERGWSETSARVHGIARCHLDGAPEASQIATDFLKRVGGRILLSDAPEFDGFWMNLLLGTIGAQGQVQLRDFDTTTLSIFRSSPIALDRIYERLARLRVPHRAGPDSLRLAQAWARGLEIAGEEILRAAVPIS